jgi:hypothetical protein
MNTFFEESFLFQDGTISIHEALRMLKKKDRKIFLYEDFAEQISQMPEFSDLSAETLMDMTESYWLPAAFIRALVSHKDFKQIPLSKAVSLGKDIESLWGKISAEGARVSREDRFRDLVDGYFKAITKRGDWKRLSQKKRIEMVILSGFNERLANLVVNSDKWKQAKNTLRVA